jgi:CBS domain-containing protein
MSASSPPPTSDPPGGDPARGAEPEPKPHDASAAAEDEPARDSTSDADAKAAGDAEAEADAKKPAEAEGATEPATSAPAEVAGPPSEEVELEPEPLPRPRTPTRPPPVPTKRPVLPKEGPTPTPPPARPSQTGTRAASDLPPRQWPPAVVADIMTRKLIALGESDPVIDLEGGMKRFRFRHLPVVSAGNKLVGLITHRDLLRAKATADEHAVETDGAPAEPAPPPIAGDLMRRDVLTARPDTPVASAARVMVQKKIGCLPVILEDNTLVGIVTDTDYVLLAIELLERT